MKLYAGTSGFSYKEWKGAFYPEKLPAKDMLEHYSRKLPAVEINSTFYRMPGTALLEGWSRRVPSEFRFSLKAPRRITHLKRLKDVVEETEYFVEQCAGLGERLGSLLFQLPPNLRKETDRLGALLRLLPPGVRAAFEFRHESWADEKVLSLLEDSNCAYCVADTDDTPGAAVVSTADWGYLRLRRASYADDDLRAWAGAIRSQSWTAAFVFFKHEDEAAGPRMASDFLRAATGGISRPC
jgi:uncharacterized protein YecE (DUF72 family)